MKGCKKISHRYMLHAITQTNKPTIVERRKDVQVRDSSYYLCLWHPGIQLEINSTITGSFITGLVDEG